MARENNSLRELQVPRINPIKAARERRESAHKKCERKRPEPAHKRRESAHNGRNASVKDQDPRKPKSPAHKSH